MSKRKIRQTNANCSRFPQFQQVQPWEHRALRWRQSEHLTTLHPPGADDRGRHEELPETQQATSGKSARLFPPYTCRSVSVCVSVRDSNAAVCVYCLGSEFFTDHGGAAADGQRHRLRLPLLGGEPLHTQVQIYNTSCTLATNVNLRVTESSQLLFEGNVTWPW